ncbi:zinc finger protein, partial [Aphelenchoides avenae]
MLRYFQAVGRELTAKQVSVKYDEIRGSRRIFRQQAMKLVRQYYSHGEVQVESTKKVSLVCPISKRRIEDACRGDQCRHLECFDLRTYLQYHTQLTYWECPVLNCRKNVSLERLRLDEYMTSILQEIPAACLEVEILWDGSFNAIVANASADVEISDEDPVVAQECEPNPVKEEPMDVAAVGPTLVSGEPELRRLHEERMNVASRNLTLHGAMKKELSEEAKETILYLAIRANFKGGSVSEVEPRVPRAVVKSKYCHLNTTLRAFVPRLPKKKKKLPEKLESVMKVDRSKIWPRTVTRYKHQIEDLFEFMSAKARTVLNAETAEGNICIAGCPRSDFDDRITCAGCTVTYHTKCLAIDGLDGLVETYYCPKCEDEAQSTEF